MNGFTAIIGLEVHIQLSTLRKIFSGTTAELMGSPNALMGYNTLGLPGCIPRLNRMVVDYAIKLCLATNCKITEKNMFARKHYFYPDLPKGYQISQSDTPIGYDGYLEIECNKQTKNIGITRIHMEEDAGKSIHLEDEPFSLLDFNRAGAPLLEIVSEPDMRTPEEAGAYLKALHRMVKYLRICNGNMEDGNFRCDVNVSVMRDTDQEFGTRVEIKNMNSFRFVEKAIAYEITRQRDMIERGQPVLRETRLWDEAEEVTKAMRTKGESGDFRCFYDPDIPPVIVNADWIYETKKLMPELPHNLKKRLMSNYGIDAYNAELLVEDRYVVDYFEKAVDTHRNPTAVCNWITTELFGRFNKEGCTILDCPISPYDLAVLVRLIDHGVISGKIAKVVFDEMYETCGNPQAIVVKRGLQQISNEAEIQKVIDRVLAENPAQLQEYKSGKVKMFGYFVGQAMKVSDGKVNPGLLNELLKKTLDS